MFIEDIFHHLTPLDLFKTVHLFYGSIYNSSELSESNMRNSQDIIFFIECCREYNIIKIPIW